MSLCALIVFENCRFQPISSQQDCINYVDNAVRLIDINDCHR